MAGTPIKRARRESGCEHSWLRLGGGEMCSSCGMTRGEVDERAADFVSPPISHEPMRARATCVQELYDKTLRGAEDALDAVLSGKLTGKDLQSTAYVATILMRSAKQLEAETPEPTTGAAALAEQADEIARLRAELAKRKRE